MAEIEVMQICSELGLDCKPYEGARFDFIIEGCLVDVKSTRVVSSAGNPRSRYYRFSVSKAQLANCDFLICRIPESRFFVIPRRHVSSCMINIAIDAALSRNANPECKARKCLNYEEAWGLFITEPKKYRAEEPR